MEPGTVLVVSLLLQLPLSSLTPQAEQVEIVKMVAESLELKTLFIFPRQTERTAPVWKYLSHYGFWVSSCNHVLICQYLIPPESKSMAVLFEEVYIRMLQALFTQAICRTLVWVVFSNSSLPSENTPVNLPYNCQVFYIATHNTTEYKLTEIYSVENTLIINDYGFHSTLGTRPLISTLYQRRFKSLNGSKLIVGLAEGVDCDLINSCEEQEVVEHLNKMLNMKIHTVDFSQRNDISLLGYPILSGRPKFFIGPIVNTELNMYIKTPELKANSNSFIKPYDVDLWLAIAAWVPVSAICILVTAFHYCKTHDQAVATLWSFGWSSLDVFCNQDGSEEAKTTPHRLSVLSSRVVALLLIPAYTASLISYLTLRTPNIPFHSYQQLIQGNKYYLNYQGESIVASFLYLYFESTRDVLDNHSYVVNDDFQVNTFCTGLYTAVGFNNDIPKNNPTCTYIKIEKPVFRTFTCLPVRDPRYLEILNRNVIMFRSGGIVHRMHVKRQFGLPKSSSLATDYVPVELEAVLLVIEVVLAGVLLSVSVVIGEHTFYHAKRYFHRGPIF